MTPSSSPTSLASRIWSRDASVWAADSATQSNIANRLGWLDGPQWLASRTGSLSEWATDLRSRGFTQAVLIGMGGSSLAAEVIADVLGPAADGLSLTVLDSTHPDAINAALGGRAWSRILFLFSSKSGSTIEVQSLCTWVMENLEEQGIAEPGAQCVAITDPNSALAELATQRRFLDCIENPTDIGGRFSALSAFGMAPAALMGASLEAMSQHATLMAVACRKLEPAANPGLELGQWLFAQSQQGRDCLQLVIEERYASLASWIEQLVAESLGKNGKGLLPLSGAEPAAPPSRLARVIIGASQSNTFWQSVSVDSEDDVPAFSIRLDADEALGGEFFRWSFATAVAGALMGVNPFDEPDVAASKAITRHLLDADGLNDEPQITPWTELQAALESAPPKSYLAILNYMAPDPVISDLIEDFAGRVRDRFGLPVTVNVGPRYLHSTGQLHKGGSPEGIFLFLRGESEFDLDIVTEDFGFAGLNQAQAMGDCAELARRGRTVSWVELDGNRFSQIQGLRLILQECLEG